MNAPSENVKKLLFTEMTIQHRWHMYKRLHSCFRFSRSACFGSKKYDKNTDVKKIYNIGLSKGISVLQLINLFEKIIISKYITILAKEEMGT